MAELRHLPPLSNQDFDFFYQGLVDGKLLAQKCSGCSELRNPPSPACPGCQSLTWEAVPLKGEGMLYSYTIHHHPPLPDYPVPHPIALVELAEGIRMTGAMDGTDPADMKVGLPVVVEFVKRGEVAGFRFKLA